MTATIDAARDALIRKSEHDAQRWSAYVDTLVLAFQRSGEPPRALGPKLEELRHKRDSLVTKVAALERHRVAGWERARAEFEVARRDLRVAWRTVIGALDRESFLV